MNASLLNDTEAAAFIAEFYGPAVAALYAAYPLGVMRADFWRYAVLYAYGGVYADIDTGCLQPLANWFPPRPRLPDSPAFVSDNSSWRSAGALQYHNLTWDDCSMVVGLENDVHMCQWAIASVPGHPVLRATLQRAIKSLEQGVQCTHDHFVHIHTGPGMWTAGLCDALGLYDTFSAADIARATWTDPDVYARARSMRLCVMAPEFFGQLGNTTAQNVRNHYSSQWGDTEAPNKRWTVEREQLAKAISNRSAAEKQRVAAAESRVATD